MATDSIVQTGGFADILAGGVANAPVIDGGTLKLEAGALIGTGAGGIQFAAANGGTLDLAAKGLIPNFGVVISGFASSDIIDVAGSGDGGDQVIWTPTGAFGLLVVQNGDRELDSLALKGNYDRTKFALTQFGASIRSPTMARSRPPPPTPAARRRRPTSPRRARLRRPAKARRRSSLTRARQPDWYWGRRRVTTC
jgi:hypothetical protein